MKADVSEKLFSISDDNFAYWSLSSTSGLNYRRSERESKPALALQPWEENPDNTTVAECIKLYYPKPVF